MSQTSFETFQELAAKATFVPVCREVLADLLTPLSAFLRVAEHADYSFLFESVEGGEQVGRYSFLGKDPFIVIRSRDGMTITEEGGKRTSSDRAFVRQLRDLMDVYQAPVVPGLPRFTGGAVGFLGYDAAKWFEPSLEPVWSKQAVPASEDDDAAFMVFDTILAFDHVKHRILIIANARVSPGAELKPAYDLACAKIHFLEQELERRLSEPSVTPTQTHKVLSNVTQEEFEKAVLVAKDYITAGDIYQVVLSQRFETVVESDPFNVYRALRHVNPSPYMYFIRMGGLSIVGSSPEMLVRVENGEVVTHPIAGTRPRGKDRDEDVRLAEELKADEKERAEHVMLVDLGRNDIGKVSDFGSVEVSRFMEIERYSHVMHLVSRVEGQLLANQDRLDALAACFPAGTVSGAPKIRAMEIISELEPDRRGIYAGAIGYLDFAGNLDCCITIRTITIKDGRAYVQAGAGIVADSDPTREFQETRDKASAMLRALTMV
ncbi:MAG: anthranilate synthase component I [Acidobacteria bacterium]|nr:anthranilate synthase component I [Acidobacteriota bacterium]|tara:strand:+ start:727 stop:2199 length:1473 start_codon:yes stop_codon:yes gene_type:complete